MDPAMVDCRSLIEFCRAFKKHRNKSSPPSSPRHRRSKSLNPLSHPFCEHSPLAALDAIVLIFVIGAVGVLTLPYFRFLFCEAYEILPAAFELIGNAVYEAPVAYGIGLVVTFLLGIALWEVLGHHSRKCGNPHCKGLRKAVEFDIQLESEECVKYLPQAPEDVFGVQPLELGRDHKELEAELKKMAPLNGRTVLIFRATCGCPAGRMEVWGPKRPRRIKK